MSFQRMDNNFSTKYRNSGNDFFNKMEFYGALKCYNQSLCLAENDSLNKALAFANRSAVYMEIGEYEKCFENIQLAKDHKYPSTTIEKLNERERKCLAKLAEQKVQPHIQDFSELSHTPNEKIPFIAACLQLRENEKYGRHVITDKKLKVGDIISLEPAFVSCPRSPEPYSRCYYCFKSNMMNLSNAMSTLCRW